MRSTDPAVAAHRAGRVATHAEILVWITARHRSTGNPESIGFWTGVDHEVFRIGGQDRSYIGAGAMLDAPDIEAAPGLEVRRHTITLSALDPGVEQAVRGYDPRHAPVELHRAEYDGTGALLAAPERIFKGWIDGTPIMTPPIGGTATVALEIVSNSRMLTQYGGGTKSDAVQQQREGDRFRRYGSIAGEAQVFWGSERSKPAIFVGS